MYPKFNPSTETHTHTHRPFYIVSFVAIDDDQFIFLPQVFYVFVYTTTPHPALKYCLSVLIVFSLRTWFIAYHTRGFTLLRAILFYFE